MFEPAKPLDDAYHGGSFKMIQSPARLLTVRTMRETQFCRFGGRVIIRPLIIHQLLGWWILFYAH